MTHNIYLYILVAAAMSCLIRVLPLILIRKKIKNRFLRSFLFYVPYVTLAVMTFPAIITAPQAPLAGILALAVGIVAAWKGMNMIGIAVLCCGVVFCGRDSFKKSSANAIRKVAPMALFAASQLPLLINGSTVLRLCSLSGNR